MNITRKGILAFAAALLAVGLLASGRDAQQISASAPAAPGNAAASWTQLSSTTGDLPAPSGSTEQTATLVLDIDKDGLNDFVIGARKEPGPSLVWYRRHAGGWDRLVIESAVLPIEAGGAFHDIDSDGDLDLVFGGDYQGNQVWWWENPYPNYAPDTNWPRHLIKNGGQNKHHDQLFGDFDNDSQVELVFWNQKAKTLFLAEIPVDPRTAVSWPLTPIYTWSDSVEREGLVKADIDGDGLLDIVGGGSWFKYNNGAFDPQVIDAGQAYSRVAAGQLVPGGRPEVVFVPGDTGGRLKWYSWDGGAWQGTDLLGFDVDHGHTLELGDVNQDGALDILVAEMRLNSGNADAKMWLFRGDNTGNFAAETLTTGFGNHESRLSDLDGDGDLDILGKPYNWQTPRLDIWLNESNCAVSLNTWDRHVVDAARPERAIFVLSGDLDGDELPDIVSGGWWYRNPGTPGGTWARNTIGAPLNNVAALHDFDGDGRLDILGTQGVGSASNSAFAWAHNTGGGSFTVYTNVPAGQGDFLQGVAVEQFTPAGPTEVMLSWHDNAQAIQALTVPANPLAETWTIRDISAFSQGEQLSAGDIDRDNDLISCWAHIGCRTNRARPPTTGPTARAAIACRSAWPPTATPARILLLKLRLT